MNRTLKILENSKSLLDEQKFYEYQQKIKTLASRSLVQKKYLNCMELQKQGCIELLQKGEINSGMDLANDWLNTVKVYLEDLRNEVESAKQVDPSTLNLKQQLSEIYHVKGYSQDKLKFMNKAMNTICKKMDSEICQMISQDALKNKDFINAHKYISVSTNFMSSLQLINAVKQSQQLKQNELNLFIFRHILLKVMFNQTDSAKKILKFTEKDWQNNVFSNYLRLLLQIIDKFKQSEDQQSQQEFKHLQEKYKGLISIDEGLREIAKQIGHNVLKIQKEQSLLGSMLNMFM